MNQGTVWPRGLSEVGRAVSRAVPRSRLPVRAAPGGAHSVRAARLSAHDIPRDVTVQAFVKPEGQTLQLLVRVPLKAHHGCRVPAPRTRLRRSGARRSVASRRRQVWLSNKIEIYEGDTPLPDAAHRLDPLLAGIGSVVRAPTTARWRTSRARRFRPTRRSSGNRACSTCCSSIRSSPIARDFSIHAAFDRLALYGDHRAALSAARRRRARLRARRRRRAGAARSALAPGGGRFVGLGFFHILDGTDHLLFLLCLVIPFRRVRTLVPIVTSFTVAHSITLIASAYGFAPEALWFPPLIETLIAMSIVYMALENIVRPNAAAALDHHVRVRPGARVRLLLRARAHAAVRRLAPADVAARVQRRRRARPAARARDARAAARFPLPARRRRADGHDHPVGARRPHRLALDDRALRRAAACSRGRRSPPPTSRARCAGCSCSWR